MRYYTSNTIRQGLLARLTYSALVTLMLFSVTSAQRKNSPEPLFTTTPPIAKKVVVEDQYHFTIRQYSPAVKVKLITRDKASYDSPEAAAISAISAMASKDFEWFRSTWDRSSIEIMDKQDKALNHSAEFWVGAWGKAFENRKVELTARIETGDYILIAYKLVKEFAHSDPPDTSGKEIELVTVLKFQEGKWLATQELSQDPVLLYWKTPEVRPKRIVRGGQIN